MRAIVKQSGYVLDLLNNIWIKPAYEGIAYNDGDEVETRIASVIKQALDLSVLSTELRRHCTDWPSLYHLSGARANVMRPFENILKGDVLEIGAGCGAITRYLGECGGNVLTLEGSPRRAAIARSRTRDLGNVTVLAERFEQFQCEHQFDVITLIGALEYANLFTSGENPPLAMLEQVRSLLKPEGKLIVAIENQLGLKYFAGAPEDHLGQPMYGIEGRYKADQPQTLGRVVLEGFLQQAGFKAFEFLLPFPDYKLPVSVLTQQGLSNKDFDASAFAWQSVRRDPQLPPYCNFSLELAWPEVFKNRMAFDVANSFLIVASPRDQQLTEIGVLAYHYSTDRVPRYCKETRFEVSGSEGIEVVYKRLGSANENERADEGQVVGIVRPVSVRYSRGMPLSWEFVQIVTRDGWTIEEVGKFLKRYVAMMEVLASQTGLTVSLANIEATLPGEFFDIVPQNIIIRADGSPEVIDREWSLSHEIKLRQILFRALFLMIGSVTRFGNNSMGWSFSQGEFVKSALSNAGFVFIEEDYSSVIEFESVLQEQITGRSASEFLAVLSWWQEQPLPMHSLTQSVAERDRQITNLNQAVYDKDVHINNLSQALTERDGQIASLNQVVTERDGQIASLNQAATERDGQIASLNQAATDRDGEIASLNQAVTDRDGQIGQLQTTVQVQQQALNTIYASLGWKLIYKYRRIKDNILPIHTRRRKIYDLILKSTKTVLNEGWRSFFQKFTNKIRQKYLTENCSYRLWIEKNEPDIAQLEAMQLELKLWSYRPKVSIITPVYNPNEYDITQCIKSVLDQIYDNWELCLVDGGSTKPYVKKIIENFAGKDHRMKFVSLSKNNGIAGNSNEALKLATGEYVGFLDHDDMLAPVALYEVVKLLNQCPTIDFIYSDEDKVSRDGKRRYDFHFKPDWSPDTLLSYNYACHFAVVRRNLVEEIGGFREGYDGAQDHDLILRIVQKTDNIKRIPKILYHWRAAHTSMASDPTLKPDACLAGKRAITEYLKNRGFEADVLDGKFLGPYRVKYKIRPSQKVSIIIPTKDRVYLLKECLSSVLTKTDYKDFEILVVDNNSLEQETFNFYNSIKDDQRIRIVSYEKPFNFSAINNYAVRNTNSQHLVFLNNDTEIISSEWLTAMLEFTQRKDIGAVGAKLYYPNDTIQHAGVIIGLGGVAGHSHKHYPRTSRGYMGRLDVIQNLSAVTAACMMIRKEVFERVEGFDERFSHAFNDVDLCLRIREKGYLIVYTPYAELYHHESKSRGYEDTPERQARFTHEIELMHRKWKHFFEKGDPYYNPNLTLDREDFGINLERRPHGWEENREPGGLRTGKSS